MVDANGIWRWDAFAHLIGYFALVQIASMPPPCEALGEDKFVWQGHILIPRIMFGKRFRSYMSRNGLGVSSGLQWKIVCPVIMSGEDAILHCLLLVSFVDQIRKLFCMPYEIALSPSQRNSVVLRISLDNASFGLSMLAHSSLLDSLQRTDSSPVNTLISPPTGWVKLNADGAVAATNAWAAAGRILRDESGLVGNIQEICCRDWEVQFAKILRVANIVADFMAKIESVQDGAVH
ncbi:hypothetical protein GOBAR_AA20512 [Gossypium barbadense]|uniref:RNase H type-1 domain-containing protein n=1 Tax=Gossypium barbadense TaxID=3634 RepID=A0A2P5X9Z1_GOSBA|nr:hypothetical protein GOBAR_AA20512 [Gossypium barbadense]